MDQPLTIQPTTSTYKQTRAFAPKSNKANLTWKQQIRRFFTAEQGDVLLHPQMSADAIISTLNAALAHQSVVSVMLNASTPFAKRLTTLTGTLSNVDGVLLLTNHGSEVTYLLLPEEIRTLGYGLSVA